MKSKRRISAGILMYRINNGKPEFLLAHPGGPYFANKDEGHWSIPKGEPDDDEEDLLMTAVREFREETGINISGEFIPLGSIIQKGGKEVFAWAVEGNLPNNFVHECNVVDIEWPPHSGKFEEYPEIDKIGFFDMETSKNKVKEAQIPLLKILEEFLNKSKR